MRSLSQFCIGIAVNAQFFAMLKMSERQQNQHFLMLLIKTQRTMIGVHQVGVNQLGRRLYAMSEVSNRTHHFYVPQYRDRDHFRAVE